MYPTAHWDLVAIVTNDRIAEAHRPAVAPAAPVTPGRVTTWGPRASRRAAATERLARVIRIPSPRDDEVLISSAAEDSVLLDA